ncbi:jg19348 [Pararge aegeria aegeria]|uniref:Jg19348 protein n=1 Tax=Pararge aegeria aegeria TaxID=348720 RepID=A0A8S4R8T6_9NEOP|nr:jg19348 [Pararge aegeria aegeria]
MGTPWKPVVNFPVVYQLPQLIAGAPALKRRGSGQLEPSDRRETCVETIGKPNSYPPPYKRSWRAANCRCLLPAWSLFTHPLRGLFLRNDVFAVVGHFYPRAVGHQSATLGTPLAAHLEGVLSRVVHSTALLAKRGRFSLLLGKGLGKHILRIADDLCYDRASDSTTNLNFL